MSVEPAVRAETPSRLGVLLGLLLVLFVVPALLLGQYWMFKLEEQASVQMELGRTLTLSRTIGALVEQEFASEILVLESVARRRLFREAWERRELAALDSHLEQARELAPEFLAVGMHDVEGTVQRVVPADPILGANLAYWDWYRGVTATSKPYVSEVYHTRMLPDRLVVGAGVPVTGPAGRLTGILMAAVSLESLKRKIGETQEGVVGDPIVVDQRGHVVLAPSIGRGPDPVPAPEPDLAAQGLAGREMAVRTGRGAHGYVVGVTPIRSLGWAVVYRRSVATALGAVFRLRDNLLRMNLYLGVVFLATVGVGAHLLRRQAVLDAKVRRHAIEQQTLLDSMSTMVATVAPDGTLLLVNRIAEAASGLPRAELMRTNFLEGPWWAFDPEVQARVGDAFRRACEGTPVSYEERILVFGKVITIIFGLTPVMGPAGRAAFVVAEGRDVTPLKTAEQTLRERTLDLEASNRELEAFSYSVSHDLRAPLRHVAGFSRILEEDYAMQLDAMARGHLRRIVDGARHMGTLIDDLLNLSRVGRAQLQRRPTDLGALVQEVRSELEAELPEPRIDWRIDSLPVVDCDRSLVRQVFVNLLSNAVKYSRPRARGEIEVGTMQQEGATAFYVRDNGVGFDMKYAHKLFGVFQRLHGVAEFEGSGVGLATVQRIVHKHGGRTWAEAAVDRGATFYFTLEPARAAEAEFVAAGEEASGHVRRD